MLYFSRYWHGDDSLIGNDHSPGNASGRPLLVLLKWRLITVITKILTYLHLLLISKPAALCYWAKNKNDDDDADDLHVCRDKALVEQSQSCVSISSSKCLMQIVRVSLIYATADEADAYMFYRCFFLFFSVFCFFPSVTKIPDNHSRERLNGFS